jgi:hypothetical protein
MDQISSLFNIYYKSEKKEFLRIKIYPKKQQTSKDEMNFNFDKIILKNDEISELF